MTESAAPSLLARDREQLDRVVRAIRDERRGFFVIVCAPELRPTAIRYLAETSGKGIPEPSPVSGHDEMVERMVSLDGKPAGSVEEFRIDASDVDVFTALNWHREKLRRAGQVLLWLDSVEGLEELQRHAPDAYSFREGVLVLAGEGGAVEGPGDAGEPPDVLTARLLFDLPRPPEVRAEAALELAKALGARGHLDQDVAVVNDGLGLIPGDRHAGARERRTRARLYEELASAAKTLGRTIDAFRACRAGIRELDPDLARRWPRWRMRLELRASSASCLTADAALLKEGLESIETETDPKKAMSIRQWTAESATSRGRFQAALQQRAQGLAVPGILLIEKGYTLLGRSRDLREMGKFRQVEADLQAAEDAFARGGIPRVTLDVHRAAFLRDRGELSSAALVLMRSTESDRPGRAGISRRTYLAGTMRHHTGDVAGAIDTFVSDIEAAAADVRDEHVYYACKYLLRVLEQITDAGAATEQDLGRALERVEPAYRGLVEYAGENPPWYAVLFPGFRASILSLCASRRAEAITTATEAISLARSLWPQALPLSTRILVQCLARAARWPDMEPAVADALQCAREADHLRELATVQAYDLVRLLHLAAPRPALEKALADLKSTFSEMGAPRVEGETWLEIAPFFPPLAAFPDPLEIADRAHGLFLDMPMPELAARCLEWLGDVYVVRGAPAEASSCYRMSLGTLQRYGLLLRKPLVEKKLAALTAA